MSKMKLKGEALYQKLKASRESLVKKYEAAGTIRYDEAIGLIPVGGNPAVSTAPANLTLPLVVNTGRREKRVVDIREDGQVAAANGRVVIDFDAIKAANIADGIPSGTMMDALKKRAEGKTILLFADDAALRYGTVILGEVSCQLKLMGNIVNAIRNGIFPQFQASNTTLLGTNNTGLIHALPGNIEQESLSHRGLVKPVNYRGDVEYLKDPTSIWATVDASRQPIMLLGVNSEIRMFGKDQVIDLNGFTIGAHERPNRIAAFSSIIDLSEGHFAGLTSKAARNAHIYSSTGVGRLARNNHFAIRGHFVKGCLVEGIVSGDASTINQGSYFGTAIFNDSQEIVFKDVHQEMLNKAVANSSMALSHYAQLANVEIALGYFERPSTWNASGALANPWMKWTDKAALDADTFGNGKTTRFPVLKTEAELITAGVPAAAAPAVLKSLKAMIAAYKKSMKSADDTYIQVNTGHNSLNAAGANRSGLSMNSLQQMTSVKQIPRSTNLIAQNAKTEDGFRYPDSVAYGFRIGSASEGVGQLAAKRGGTVQDVYIMDCTFAGMHLSPMETLAIAAPNGGFNKTFNGNGLRPFGYTNSLSDAASIAPAILLLSKEEMESQVPATKLSTKPVDAFDTAAKAAANAPLAGWTAKKASGVYKGNDVNEAGLAAVEAIQLLKKYFTAAIPQAQLGGLDNSNIDIGILALRKSMMVALNALTANHVGLKGGFQGDIFQDSGDYYSYGEIYPWFVSADETVSIDKDKILEQAAARTDRRQTTAYIAAELPTISDSIFKLKLVSADTLALVKADSETPVTYAECVALLGFGTASSTPVTYKIARNLDGQHHNHKGVFGVRLDNTTDFCIDNVVVKDLETSGAKKPMSALGSKQTQLDFGIQAAEEMESSVLKVRGISINGCTEGSVENVLVAESEAGGFASAVEIRGQSAVVEVSGVVVNEFKAFDKAVGLKISKDVSDVQVSKVKVSEISATDAFGVAVPVEIQSEDVKVK
jgi:hypothetical protein